MPSARRALILALNLALAAVAIWRVSRFFVTIDTAAPFQYDFEEGNELNALLRITQGATPYPDPHALPSIINPYGPAAYYLLALPVKAFGLEFVYPREMILGCAVLIAITISLTLWRETRSVAPALAFGLTYLCIPNIQKWGWLLRVDLLGITFTIAGLMVLCWRSEGERGRVILASVLFAAGLLVKPTLIAAPAACFVVLIIRRSFREAAMLAGATAALGALVMAIFTVITRGAVLTQILLSHPDPFSLWRYAHGLALMLKASWPLAVLAVIAIVYDVAQRRLSFPALWLMFATATAITAGKLGSNSNHFLEWNTALCLAAGLGMHRLMNLRSEAIAVATVAVSVTATAFVTAGESGLADKVARERGCLQAYEWVRTKAGPNLLAENVGALVLGNRRVWVSAPFSLAQLVERAGWSDAELVRMVREQHFDAVITGSNYPPTPSNLTTGAPRFSPELLGALHESYAPEPGFQCLDMNIVFKPRRTQLQPSEGNLTLGVRGSHN